MAIEYRARVMRDDCPSVNHRNDYDHASVLYIVPNRYFEGDKGAEPFFVPEHKGVEKDYVVLSVYSYIHGAIALSTTPFGCAYDSGRVGTLYVAKSACQGMSDDDIVKMLEAELEDYERYLNGDVWEILVEKVTMCDDCGHEKEVEYLEGLCGVYGNMSIDSLLDNFEPEHHDMIRYAWERR